MKNAGEINGSTSDEEARLTAQKLLSFISIRTDPQANLIVIELVGSQKDSIPIYANSLARAFQKIEQDVKVKEEAKMRKFLKEKAEDRKKKFEQAELVLANLNQQRYSSGLSGNVNLKARRRAQLAFEEAKLEEDNRALETRMAEDSSESGDNPELKGLLLRRQLLQQQRQSLLDKYTEAHHEVVKINDQIDQVSLDIQAEASTLHDKRVRTLNDLLISNEEVLQTIRAEKSDLDLFFEELPNSEKKKAELETARDLEKSLYEMFRTRIEELELLHQTRPEAVIIRSPAGDSIKIFPDDDLLYSLCFTLAIIVGFGSGFLWELLDTSPKSIDEIEKYAGCSVVGVVPNIIFTPSENAGTKPMAGKPSEADPGAILHYQPRHPASEAFRSAASSLEFAFLTPEENNTICITSAAPGEGKTTASSNLSIALAHSGLKVLLVDACLRESGVTTLYNLSGRAGLKDAMEGFIPWRACVCPTSINGLEMLPAGNKTENPVDLLRDSFGKLLFELKPHYDAIIIDTPPILPVIDAVISSENADGIFMVYSTSDTPKDVLERAKAKLGKEADKLQGVLLNKVKREGELGQYYYSYYYAYYPKRDKEFKTTKADKE